MLLAECVKTAKSLKIMLTVQTVKTRETSKTAKTANTMSIVDEECKHSQDCTYSKDSKDCRS